MDNYIRLTKSMIGDNGEKYAVCSLFDTDKCVNPIHNSCEHCKMNTVRLAQLYDLEEQLSQIKVSKNDIENKVDTEDI